MLVVSYIYFTRIIVFLLGSTLPWEQVFFHVVFSLIHVVFSLIHVVFSFIHVVFSLGLLGDDCDARSDVPLLRGHRLQIPVRFEVHFESMLSPF